MKPNKVALAPFLLSCSSIITLGIRAAIDDYSANEKELLRSAERVFFPTPRFAYLFDALQIPTFPDYHTYRLQHSRVLQQVLLAATGMPRPMTRMYFGKRQKAMIPENFPFPFMAIGPLPALHEKHLVENQEALEQYSRRYNPLIIQKVVDWSERLRILCVHTDCVGVLYQDTSQSPGTHYEPVPVEHPKFQGVLGMTRDFIRRVHLDDMVLEWGYGDGKWQLLQLARPPVRWPMPEGTLNRHHYIGRLVQSGRL